MRAPILPYYGDQFMGVSPPLPSAIKHNYPAGVGLLANSWVVIPCVDANDGSCLVIDNTGRGGSTVIKRYNPAGALVWANDLWSSQYPETPTVRCGVCYDKASNRYYMGSSYNATNGYYYTRLLYITDHATGNIVAKNKNIYASPVFPSFSTSVVTSMHSSVRSDGYMSIIYAGKELLFDVNTGASSFSSINNNGIPLPSGIDYRSVDGTIYCSSVYMMPSGLAAMDIIRNGYQIKVPINWVRPSNLTAGDEYNYVSPMILGDYIYFAEHSKQFAVGIKTVKRTEFDAWLDRVCNSMGV